MIQPIPPKYLERMHSLLGDEFADFVSCFDRQPESGLRVNTLKLSVEEYLRLSPFALSPVAWCPAAFHIQDNAQPGKHPHHAAGLYYLQDPSAMLAAEALRPAPGERVLDLAAAPGGKSTHLAALMQGQGILVTNEIHPKRVWELAENLERWGTVNASITNETPERLAEHFGAYFDKVLLDAPCSGEGMFRKSDAARLAWSPALVESCARRQAALINQARRLVRPGGCLLYTTCTFSVEENEGVIAAFLKSHPDFELEDLAKQNGFAGGYQAWTYGEEAISIEPDMRRAVRLWPQRIRGEGHFLARLRRIDGEQPRDKRRRPASDLTAEARRLFTEFTSTSLKSWDSEGTIVQRGTYLYLLPPHSPDLKGLHVIHPGLWLGTLKKNRFEPSHALAMSLRSEQAERAIDLDEAQALAYLRGQSLPSVSPVAGWTLLTADQNPLGWGKCSQGMVKNYFPHGLRWKG
jgi:NOL1/NOP2/sun family putative RNA methylase